jgi:hypothetical protein
MTIDLLKKNHNNPSLPTLEGLKIMSRNLREATNPRSSRNLREATRAPPILALDRLSLSSPPLFDYYQI